MIEFQLPGIPISLNNAYFTQVVRKGGKLVPIRTLTKEGKRYKAEVSAYLARERQDVLKFFQPNTSYVLLAYLHCHGVFNKGYGTAGTNRHKRFDVSNRVKLLEDALTEACGYDDCQNMGIGAVKVPTESAEKEFTLVRAWNADEEDTPITQCLTQ